MNKYEYNDYELLDYACENNEDATKILYDKYKSVIESIARAKINNNLGLEFNDLVQEGMIGFSEAIRDYKNQKDVTFYTFASLCIERQILTALKKASRDKHKILNDSISLDYNYDEESNLYDNIGDANQLTPEDTVIEMEEEKQLYAIIIDKLSAFEKQVFDLKLQNFSYKEIAQLLNTDSKKIDNAIQRIKQKASVALTNKFVE